MATIARLEMGEEFDAERLAQPFGMAMYYLIPEVTCLLGLLLWATPAISTEIEGQTWVYLTLRGSGRSAVVIGKYLTAVFWTLSAALSATTISSVLVGPIIGWRIWGGLCACCPFCPALCMPRCTWQSAPCSSAEPWWQRLDTRSSWNTWSRLSPHWSTSSRFTIGCAGSWRIG